MSGILDRWQPRAINCCVALGITPNSLTTIEYICWIGPQIREFARENPSLAEVGLGGTIIRDQDAFSAWLDRRFPIASLEARP